MAPNDDNVKIKALLPAIAMFHDPPAWTTAAEAPSDWAMLQRAKALRLQKAQGEVDMPEPESKTEAQNKPDLTEYPLAVAAAGLAPSSHHRRSSLLFGFVALLAVGFLLWSTTTAPSSFNVGTVGVGPIKLSQKLFRPAEKEASGPQFFLPRAKRQTKKILGLASTFAFVDNDKCTALVDSDMSTAPVSRRPVTTNDAADTDTKPSTTVPSIVEDSAFMANPGFTSPFLDSYYALGSFFVDQSQHVWSLLRDQLVQLRVVWDDNSHVLGSFVAAVPSIVKASTLMENLEFTSTISPDTDSYALGSLLRRQLVKVRVVWDDTSYALISFVAGKPQQVRSLLHYALGSLLHRQLRRQLGKVRVVWDDNSYALGSSVADKPQHVRSLLHRQLVELRGIVRGVLVVPLP
jgi:hypothetical protein